MGVVVGVVVALEPLLSKIPGSGPDRTPGLLSDSYVVNSYMIKGRSFVILGNMNACIVHRSEIS
jgi:hypothetical protein